jgi:hypothetical protein
VINHIFPFPATGGRAGQAGWLLLQVRDQRTWLREARMDSGPAMPAPICGPIGDGSIDGEAGGGDCTQRRGNGAAGPGQDEAGSGGPEAMARREQTFPT